MSQSLVPSSNAPADGSADSEAELERRAQAQRAQLDATLGALKDKFDNQRDKLEDAQDQLQSVDAKIRRWRWALVGGAVLVGALVGRRKRAPAPKAQVYLLPASTDVTQVVPEAVRPPSRSMFRTALSAVAGHVARRAVQQWMSKM